ncbi:hypothetical protein CAOG_004086 [Capsaspora owczarzaki ATCC 30864]|uniref:Integrin beta n=1 Tax=Capsaspora owczarzaki (strain ATCC 30864) TaxID=595528 RepID=A0A0D2X2W6_CAPO3|nr:hypothetical protein CAOG_004086 [Capsaspora owczarzaki ATCC 30864]
MSALQKSAAITAAAAASACIAATNAAARQLHQQRRMEDCTALELQSCNACLSKTSSCGWCKSTGACMLNTDGTAQCPQASWINPTGQLLPNNVPGASAGAFQPSPSASVFSPANGTAQLRMGREFTFDITVTPVQYPPVDFYLLLDASSGMFSDIHTLQQLRTNITEWLASQSPSVRFGLGVFVEKPVQPFTDPDVAWPPANLPTQNVQHLLNFTSDPLEFHAALQAVQVSSDLDAPNSVLDALSQIALCPSIINWRSDARQIVFVLTNDGYHLAMDGLRARIETPFVPTCQLVQQPSGAFVAPMTTHDYPSVAEFVRAFSPSGVVPIFGVPASRPHLSWAYGRPNGLVEQLGHGAVVQLDERATNLMLRLQQGYRAVANSVHIYDPSGNAIVRRVQPSSASVLDVTGAQVATSVTVSVTLFTPTRLTAPVTLGLRASGQPASFPIIVSDGALVACTSGCVGATCANNCFNRGACDCGRCANCTGGYSGSQCQTRVEDACPLINGLACSGHGTCQGFGRCKCDDGWQHGVTGGAILEATCSCSTASCPVDANGLLCGNHGSCSCGRCVCEGAWSGIDCTCDSSLSCPASAKNCGGPARGACECGACRCIAPWYGEDCSLCTPGESGCPLTTTSICQTFSNDCAACATYSDDYNTTCFWCNDIMACLPSGNEQTCQQIVTAALVGDCRCLSDCENDVFVRYTSDNTQSYAFTQTADTDPGPVIGLAAGCMILMGLFVLLVARLIVHQQANQEWKRFYQIRSDMQSGKGKPRNTTSMIHNELYEGNTPKSKGKGKASKSSDESDAPKKRKPASGDAKPKRPHKRRSDSDDSD